MSDNSSIEWTDATWNPVTGCTKVSPGCARCYIERTPPFRMEGRTFVGGATDVGLHEDRLDQPLRWRRPRRVFVNSLGDLFHEAVPEAFVLRAFEAMAAAPRHQFQLLTKRSARLRELAGRLPWPGHVWMGVSVEDERHVGRITDLRAVPAAVRFVSLEPMLGPIPNLPLDELGWVIVGGESGSGHRPMDPQWARCLRDQCLAASVPFFFKQWGGTRAKSGGRLLDGRTWDEMPRRG